MPGGYLKVELSAFSKGLTNQRVFFMANLTSKNRLEKTCCKAGPLSRFVHWVYAMYDYVYIHVCIYIYTQTALQEAPFYILYQTESAVRFDGKCSPDQHVHLFCPLGI